MKKFHGFRGIAVGLVAVALLLGGVATASNMGFKFVPNIGANAVFNLALPWNNNYTKANELFNDLPGAERVSKVKADNTGSVDWFSGQSNNFNFDVIKAEGYKVFAGASGVTTAVIVGSHDPNYSLNFTANEVFNLGAPYHGTHSKANELFNDLNTQTGDGIDRIAKVKSDNTGNIDWFSGQSNTFNFTIELGEAVITFAGSGGGPYNYPHY